jgi:hypothetical protein
MDQRGSQLQINTLVGIKVSHQQLLLKLHQASLMDQRGSQLQINTLVGIKVSLHLKMYQVIKHLPQHHHQV